MQPITDYFQDTAYRLGYKPEDLLPITRESVEAESIAFTKGMSEKERDYYINRKVVTLLQRQNKIIGQVQQEIKKHQLSYKLAPESSQLHNPAILKLLNDHQKIILKNQKFLDTLQRSKQLQLARRQRLSVSSNSNTRKSDRQINNHSSVSRRSVQSNKSGLSNQSNRSSASTKERLMLVRSREKEEAQIKRQLMRQRQRENSKKSLKAEEEALKRSQRVKTRSQINRQIVEQNRKDLRFLHNTQIKDHFERLKFKLQKTEQIRANNAQRRQQHSQQIDRLAQRKQSEQTSRKELAYRYSDKLKAASMRIQNHEVLRREAHNYNRLTQDLKTFNARKNRQMMARQQQQLAAAIRRSQEQRLRTAELNRQSLNGEYRLKQIGQEVRHEITRKNVADLTHKRQLESEAAHRKLNQKFQQLRQMETVKHKLGKERGHVIRELNLQRKTLDNRNDKSKFNSFFDI